MDTTKSLTLNTEASNSSLPDVIASFGLSRLIVWKRPSDDRKSGMPACTDIPAPEYFVGLFFDSTAANASYTNRR
jgi:hypothetical protein